MRRVFDEISDEEWENHTFNPSKVLKKGRASPPSIESFAYRPQSHVISNQNGIDLTNVVNLDDDDDDDEVEEVELEEAPLLANRATRSNRGRRYVVDEDSDPEAWDDVIEDRPMEKEDEEEFSFGSEEEGKEEEEKWEDKDFDVVGKALHKCAKISADLRGVLYGSSVSACDRYAEVEASSVRIVTQEDIDEACASEDSDFEPNLKPYQLVGVNFLLLLYRKKIGGAILADEMGLGKTVQAVTYLTLLKHLNDDPGPHLIVCPASVLENWERELKRWCPSFSVILFHGAGRAVYSKELSSMGKAGLPPPFNVLLSCYSLFERRSSQQKDDRKELWSLLEFMMPDIFTTGDMDLKKLLNVEETDLIPRIKSILGPFILRRLKSDVIQQLVRKIQHVEYVVMDEEQSAAYNDAITNYRAASESRTLKSSVRAPNDLRGLFPSRQISNYFMQFRKIANHPLLVRSIYCDEDVVRIAKILYPKGVFGFECPLERAIQEMNGYNDFSIHQGD